MPHLLQHFHEHPLERRIIALKLRIWPRAWSVSVSLLRSVLIKIIQTFEASEWCLQLLSLGGSALPMRGCCSTAEPAGPLGVPGKWLFTYSCASLACNPPKHDKIDLTSMWLPGRHTGSKINIREILPRNKPIGTIWMGPVHALRPWEAHGKPTKYRWMGED